jgi:hypothetical protein
MGMLLLQACPCKDYNQVCFEYTYTHFLRLIRVSVGPRLVGGSGRVDDSDRISNHRQDPRLSGFVSNESCAVSDRSNRDTRQLAAFCSAPRGRNEKLFSLGSSYSCYLLVSGSFYLSTY